MTRHTFTVVSAILFYSTALFGQQSVDPRNTYHRIICVLPIIPGSGTPADPRRPKYAPAPGQLSPDGIIAFTQVSTDDGKAAIVEFVARKRSAFSTILADTSVPIYEKGAQNTTAIEAALQKFKKGFSLVNFEAVMP